MLLLYAYRWILAGRHIYYTMSVTPVAADEARTISPIMAPLCRQAEAYRLRLAVIILLDIEGYTEIIRRRMYLSLMPAYRLVHYQRLSHLYRRKRSKQSPPIPLAFTFIYYHACRRQRAAAKTSLMLTPRKYNSIIALASARCSASRHRASLTIHYIAALCHY